MSLSSATRSRSGQVRLLLALLLLLGLALVFAGSRAWQTYRAYQRLSSPETGAADVVRIRDFAPLGVVARRSGVPEAVLLEALREAGFVLEPRPVPTGLPEGLRRRLNPPGRGVPPGGAPSGSAPPGSAPGGPGPTPGGGDGGRLLEPAQQSLRQIAEASGRAPAEAARVVQDAIREYRQARAGVGR